MEQEKKYLKIDVKEFEGFLTEFGKTFTYNQAAPFMNKFSQLMPSWLRAGEDDSDRIAALSKMLEDKTSTVSILSARIETLEAEAEAAAVETKKVDGRKRSGKTALSRYEEEDTDER